MRTASTDNRNLGAHLLTAPVFHFIENLFCSGALLSILRTIVCTNKQSIIKHNSHQYPIEKEIKRFKLKKRNAVTRCR